MLPQLEIASPNMLTYEYGKKTYNGSIHGGFQRGDARAGRSAACPKTLLDPGPGAPRGRRDREGRGTPGQQERF